MEISDRPTLPEYIAAVHPDGAPGSLVPVRLVPVEAFGGDCDCHLEHDHDGNPCAGWGYGLMDAVPGYSDCNRAHGRIYRRDEDWSLRDPSEVIVVWVASAEIKKFDQIFGN